MAGHDSQRKEQQQQQRSKQVRVFVNEVAWEYEWNGRDQERKEEWSKACCFLFLRRIFLRPTKGLKWMEKSSHIFLASRLVIS